MRTNVFYGKKTVLFPFMDNDFQYFIDLHRGDKKGYMGKFSLCKMTDQEAKLYIKALLGGYQMFIWTVMTKGKDAKRVGFIYFFDVNSFSCSIAGMIDPEFTKKFVKKFKRGDLTPTEDATRTLITAAFNEFEFDRIDGDVIKSNRLGYAIHRRLGFKQEGVRRKAFRNGDIQDDIIMMAILKEEWNNGEEFTTNSRDTEIYTASKG